MIVNEVVMGEAVIVEELYEESIVRDESACDKWVRESLNWHGVVVDTESLVDVELLFTNHLRTPRLLPKHSEPKFAVIDEGNGIFFTRRVLLNLLEPDETIFLTANLFLESLLIGLKIVHAHPVLAIIFLSHHDGPGRIVGDHARHHGVRCLNALVFGEILEIVCVALELDIRLEAIFVFLLVVILLFVVAVLGFVIVVIDVLPGGVLYSLIFSTFI